jgi:hypothetical protein
MVLWLRNFSIRRKHKPLQKSNGLAFSLPEFAGTRVPQALIGLMQAALLELDQSQPGKSGDRSAKGIRDKGRSGALDRLPV